MYLVAAYSLFLAFTNAFGHLHPDEKIVGGIDTDIEQVPFQVALEWLGEQYCGGSIITSKYILTAAHCVYTMNVEDVTVRIGSKQWEYGGTVIQALNFTHHPNYTHWGFDEDCDVSVIELTEEIKLSNKSQIISLTDLEPAPGTYVTASGWGNTGLDNDVASILQSTEMVVVNREDCFKIYGNSLTEHMFCAGDARGTCKGDSGGPVTQEEASGERVQVGIVSWGKDGCAQPDYPGVYVNIAHPDIKNFILQTIGVK